MEGPLESSRQAIPIDKFIEHPLFDSSNGYLVNDVALLRLATPIVNLTASPELASICVPEKEKSDKEEFAEELATATGWGVLFSGSSTPTDVLMKVFLPMVNVSKCVDVFEPQKGDEKTWLCAFKEGKDTCQVFKIG